MDILSKLFKKRRSPDFFGDSKIVYITKEEIPKKQKKAINTIIKNGINSGLSSFQMEFLIEEKTGLNVSINHDCVKNSIKVIIY